MAGFGNYLAADYLECLSKKIDHVHHSIGENLGETIIWSDVDIQFFKFDAHALADEMQQRDLDLYIQELRIGSRIACGGFYAVHCNSRTLRFFADVAEITRTEMNGFDQDAINKLLNCNKHGLAFDFLPPSYYARTHGLIPPRDLVLHHATCTVLNDSVRQKLDQLSEIRWLMSARPFRLPLYLAKNLPVSLWHRLRVKLGHSLNGCSVGAGV